MQQPLLLIGIIGAAFVALLIYGLYTLVTRRKSIVSERLVTYANIEEEAARATAEEFGKQNVVQRAVRFFVGAGYFGKLEEQLAGADIPMKPTEYVLLRLVLAALGFVLGYYGFGYLHSGLVLAVVGFFVPAMVVRIHHNRRRAKFVRQLADALMLLTNSLRSGYSFVKGLELVAKEMDDPISKELNRMLREISLGATIEDAMTNLGRRVHSLDLDIVISAYLVQKDVGGNLTEIMEKVAETIRERIRIQGDIKTLTAQGRLSGLIVGLLPLAIFFFLIIRAPDYFKVMIEDPRWPVLGMQVPVGVLILLGGLIWQLLGGFLIYKIINIKV
jgi:tight adherence protein B